MAVSINWQTRVIFVPQADLVFLGGTKYSMDIDWFRLQLKALEAGEEGMIFPDTHRNEPPVTISGIDYARKIEIINGYTVTFENGAYSVYVVGGNSNIQDVLNNNSVGVSTANSAGLTDPSAMVKAQRRLQYLIETGVRGEHGAVGEMIFLDPINGSDLNDGQSPSETAPGKGPLLTWAAAYAMAVDGRHDIIQLVQQGPNTVLTANLVLAKRDLQIRGPGKSLILRPSNPASPVIQVTADGVGLQGFSIEGAASGTANAVEVNASYFGMRDIHIDAARNHGVVLADGIQDITINTIGIHDGLGDGIVIGETNDVVVSGCHIHGGVNGIRFAVTTPPVHVSATVRDTNIHNASGYGVVIPAGSLHNVLENLWLYGNTAGNIDNAEPTTQLDDAAEADSNTAAYGVVQTGSTASIVRTSISKPDGFFDDMLLRVDGDDGIAAVRRVSSYAQANGAFTLDAPLPFTPTEDRLAVVLADYATATGAGTADWTTTERNQIRHRLGIDGTAAAPAATPSLAAAAAVAAVQADTDDIQARLPATLSGGRMRSQIEGLDPDTITASAIAPAAITSSEAPALANLDAAVSSRAAPGAAMDLVGNAVDAAALAADAVTEIAAATRTWTVKTGLVYEDAPPTLRVSASLETDGQHDANVTSATLTVYNGATGALMFTVNDVAPDAQGVFYFERTTPGFAANWIYLAMIAITAPGGVYTTGRHIPVVG